MKKLICALITAGLLAGALGGCTAAGKPYEEDADSPSDTFEKTEQISLLDKDGTVIRTLTEKTELNAFFDALEAADWDSLLLKEDAPKGAEVELTVVFQQTPTETVLGGKSAEGEFEDLMQLTLYKDSTAAMLSLGEWLSFTVEMPEAARETLLELAKPAAE